MQARHHDPFAVLGCHSIADTKDDTVCIRVMLPHTRELRLLDTGNAFTRVSNTDIFEWHGSRSVIPQHYQLQRIDSNGQTSTLYDTYSFTPQLPDFDLELFAAGKHLHIYNFLGANPRQVDGIDGILFAIWAPNAERVSVIGDFNQWDGRTHPMRSRGSTGVWELFIPGFPQSSLYKFELRQRGSGQISEKTDPYARALEIRPRTAARVYQSAHQWQDSAWMTQRSQQDWLHSPFSIYEVHLGSWQRDSDDNFLDYRTLAHRLVEYVTELGFTHIELLPITEFPYDASWGYQTTGYFAPTSRFGTPDDFRYFVDYCHAHNIGIILDWVPAHFPRDAHALAKFDGTPLYEHADPRRGEHPDWGTLIFNYGRNEVRNFLISSAIFWLKEFHIDALRVDAVASMLYLDYSREGGDWLANEYGGNENLDAIHFLRELNTVTHAEHPGSLVMAEESTAWPQVTRPVELGGLGFSMKWNMGWMHDMLEYMKKQMVHRSHHHSSLTFGLLYAFTENFVLPFSHDEVVHGKSSLLYRMPGDEWQRFANLRLLYTFMFAYPGKKLLFMGCEFAQGREWNFEAALDWYVLEYPFHHGVQILVADLNKLYCSHPALYEHDFEPQGFDWIDCNDASQSVLSFTRRAGNKHIVVVLNFTEVPREGYRVGVPVAGCYRELVNSDSGFYSGSNLGNAGELHSENIAWMNRPQSIVLTLPPLAGIILELA